MPVRLTVRDLVVMTGLVGVLLGSFRSHFSIGCFVSGILVMATIRTTERLDQRWATGSPIRDRDRFRIFGTSLVLASILLATSLAPLLYTYSALGPHVARSNGCRVPSHEPDHLIILSSTLGLPIAVAMRRLIW